MDTFPIRKQSTSSLVVFITGIPVNRFEMSGPWVATLAEWYERTMSRLEQITEAGYHVNIQWKCEFDNERIVNQKQELLTHPIVEQSPLHTRDAL
jgi:G:T-mismatch repair DNA endonuclease (very short patch repair protein)